MEDSGSEADFNFILTRSQKIIEIQGSAERHPLTWDQYEGMKILAQKGADDMFEFYDQNPYISPTESLGATLRSKPHSFSAME